MQIAFLTPVFWYHTVSKYPRLSPRCQQTHRAPPDMQVVVWLDGRWRESVHHMTSGLAAFNEIIILRLQAINLASCSLTWVWFYSRIWSTYGRQTINERRYGWSHIKSYIRWRMRCEAHRKWEVKMTSVARVMYVCAHIGEVGRKLVQRVS